MRSILRARTVGLAVSAGLAVVAPEAFAQCVGTCGTGSANGDVTASPLGGTYSYVVTTFDSPNGGGSLPGVAESTNGSRNSTAVFSALAGDKLSFYFNYITSDGNEFSDYSWAELQTPSGTPVVTLFSARTTPSGDTVPGFGLPPLLATLTPAVTRIFNGTGEQFEESGSFGPVWAPLGDDSGLCYAVGCGLTRWIKAEYMIAGAGSYRLAFGVSNSQDTVYQSGLAYAGVSIGDTPVPEIPEPATWGMMIAGLGVACFAARRRRHMVSGAG